MSDEPLITPRLILRRMTAYDGPALFALDIDPEVVRYAEPELMHAPRSLAEVDRLVLPPILRGYETDPPSEFWAVVERAGAGFIGWVFLRPLPDEDAWELGYRFRRSAWGKGYATEACRAAIDHVSATRGTATVVAFIDPEHVASQRVAEKLGLRRAGVHDDGDVRYEARRA